MQAFRQPQFSQAPAWLPPWLLPLSLPSGVDYYETPPMFATSSLKDLGDTSTCLEQNKNSTFHASRDASNMTRNVLFLSGDDDTTTQSLKFQNYNCFREDGPGSLSLNQQPKKLILQLSLSAQDSSVLISQDTENFQKEQCNENRVEGDSTLDLTIPPDPGHQMVDDLSKLLGHAHTHQQEVSQLKKYTGATEMCLNLEPSEGICGQAVVSPLSQQTVSTELYVPPDTDHICNDAKICSIHALQVSEQLSLMSNRPIEKTGNILLQRMPNLQFDGEVKEEISLKTSTEKRQMSGSRGANKVKMRKPNPITEDVEATIAQIVTAAEAMVVANVMESCNACQNFGPTAILDAALQLKRGRQMCGLDEFTLDPLFAVPDDEGFIGSHDGFLEDAYNDVGLVCEPNSRFATLNQVMNAATSTENAIAAINLSLKAVPCLVVTAQSGKKEVCINHGNPLISSYLEQNVPSLGNEMTGQKRNSGFMISECEPTQSENSHHDLEQSELNGGKRFVSRWLGGWSGKDTKIEHRKDVETLAGTKGVAIKAYETSNLSESINIVTEHIVPEQLAISFKRKDPLPVVNKPLKQLGTRDICHIKNLSAASCAGILVTLSQASVIGSTPSCSELLCSFVPCSISEPHASHPHHAISPSGQAASPSIVFNEVRIRKGEKWTSAGPWSSSQFATKSNNDNFTWNSDGDRDQYSADKIEPGHNVSLLELPNGVKRTQLSTLKPYSTDINSHMLLYQALAVGDAKENLHCMEIADIGQLMGKTKQVNSKGHLTAMVDAEDERVVNTSSRSSNENLVEMCNPNVPGASLSQKNTVEIEDKLTQRLLPCSCPSDEHDPSPLLWHCGRKRRLRACRVVESGSSQDYNNDNTSRAAFGCYSATKKQRKTLEIGNDSLEDGFKDYNSLEYAKKEVNIQERTMDKKKGHLVMGGTSPSLQKKAFKEDINQLDHQQNWGKRMRKENVICPARSISRKPRNSCSAEQGMFKDLLFLLTGFPALERNKLAKKIAAQAGVLLSDIPRFTGFSARKTRQREGMSAMPPIVIAPQQVRTTKFLYGCAVGSLIVRPDWIDDCITTRRFLSTPMHGHRLNKCAAQESPDSLSNVNNEIANLFFSGIQVMLHGRPAFCSKLASLVQHGGGRVSRITKDSVPCKKLKCSWSQIIVMEEQKRISRRLKHAAVNLEVPIVSGEWLVESLLAGKLLPFPAMASNMRLHSVRGVAASDLVGSMADCFEENTENGVCNRGNMLRLNQEKHGLQTHDSCLRLHTINPSVKVGTEDTLLVDKSVEVDESDVTLVGKGSLSPPTPVNKYQLLKKKCVTRSQKKLSGTFLHHKSAIVKGITFSAGDIVEIKPYTQEETEPYVAQIEGFVSSSLKTRLAKGIWGSHPCKKAHMRCRWYYRPSDTAFPCLGSDKELYFSEHYDDNVPIQNLIRKVSMVPSVGGKPLTCSDENNGVAPLACDTHFDAASAEYICRFFYNHEDESLHSLKSIFKF